jgi:hypothetical protein
MTIDEVRPYQDKSVILCLHDGEIARARILFVDLEYEDIIVDIIDSNRIQEYKGWSNDTYAIRADDLASIQEISS